MRWLCASARTLSAVLLLLAAPSIGRAQLPDFASVVRNESASVVSVSVALSASDETDEEEEFADALERFFGRRRTDAVGAGFIVAADGYVVTSAHLVTGPRQGQVLVRLADGREFEARVVGVDPETDIGVLKINASGLRPARTADPEALQVGDWVAAIGSPFGFERSLTVGVVSGKGRTLADQSYVPFIQTDVAVNPGNSGGPLFSARGEVVAVNSLIYSDTGSYMGVSFAVPIDIVLEVAAQLRARGHVTRGALGVRVQDLGAALAGAFAAPSPAGALVSDIYPEGPATLRPGDIVVRFDGKPVESGAELLRLIRRAAPGSTVAIQVLRGGARVAAKVAIEEQGAFRRAPRTVPEPAVDRYGLQLEEITAVERERLGIRTGVLVKRAEGPAQRAELRRGDVVLSVNGAEVGSAAELRERLGKIARGGYAALRIQRAGARLFVPLRIPG